MDTVSPAAIDPIRTQVELTRYPRRIAYKQVLVLWVIALERSIEVNDMVTIEDYEGNWTVTRVLTTLRQSDICVPRTLGTLTTLYRLYGRT